MVYGGVPNLLVRNETVGTGKIARLAALTTQAWVAVCADHPAEEAIGLAVAKISQSVELLGRPGLACETKERAVLDAGHKALTVDAELPWVAGMPEVEYVWAADEHGKLTLRNPNRSLEIGCKLRLIPGRCDPTVNLYDWYVGYRNDRVKAIWPFTARGASR